MFIYRRAKARLEAVEFSRPPLLAGELADKKIRGLIQPPNPGNTLIGTG
jgi:hypothetical protein